MDKITKRRAEELAQRKEGMKAMNSPKEAKVAKTGQTKKSNKAAKLAEATVIAVPAKEQISLLEAKLEGKNQELANVESAFNASLTTVVEQFNKLLAIYANNHEQIQAMIASLKGGNKLYYFLFLLLGFIIGGVSMYFGNGGTL